jgi:hypothetical protein
MDRSARRRKSGLSTRAKRVIAVVATLTVFGGLITVSQISSADSRRGNSTKRAAAAACPSIDPAADAPNGQNLTTSRQNGRTVRNHWGDGQPAENGANVPAGCLPATNAGTGNGRGNGNNNNGGNNNGNGNNNGGNNATTPPATVAPPPPLDILADSCDNSRLAPHDGFQNGNRCVDTEFGEVGSANNNPSLLITQFPQRVQANQAFTLRVSTRNLIRDRFLAAGQGGYYVESSLLNGQGLVRGHFHSACRMLNNTNNAPDPAPAPAFFVATEDGGGGAQPDSINIQVPGLPQNGIAQCAVWAGDGSHRIPMMERANQTPAFDAVRITVGN